jgi:cytidine deaminase
MSSEVLPQWLQAAKVARAHAYAPYSSFQVGAVLIDETGEMHLGCNVENAAYGPTNCAERTALFRAVADGKRSHAFKAMVVIADTTEPIQPCGTCRQVLQELCAPDMPIYLANMHGTILKTTVNALLPSAFSAKQLKKE